MEASLLSILPNLSIGVISVISLAYISIKHAETQKKSQDVFIKSLEDRADKYQSGQQVHADEMRELNAIVRNSMQEQLMRNTVALTDVSKVLGRVVRQLDGEK